MDHDLDHQDGYHSDSARTSPTNTDAGSSHTLEQPCAHLCNCQDFKQEVTSKLAAIFEGQQAILQMLQSVALKLEEQSIQMEALEFRVLHSAAANNESPTTNCLARSSVHLTQLPLEEAVESLLHQSEIESAEVQLPLDVQPAAPAGNDAGCFVIPDTIISQAMQDSKHRANFASQLVRRLFPASVLKSSNVAGRRGKRRLDPQILGAVQQLVFRRFALQIGEDGPSAWRNCVKAIDAYSRNL